MRRALIGALLMLTAAAPARAQNFAPPPPPVARPGAPLATICSTDYGWCPIQAMMAPGVSCYCFVPPNTWLPGLSRFWLYRGPVSPYLNPHQTPPSTLP